MRVITPRVLCEILPQWNVFEYFFFFYYRKNNNHVRSNESYKFDLDVFRRFFFSVYKINYHTTIQRHRRQYYRHNNNNNNTPWTFFCPGVVVQNSTGRIFLARDSRKIIIFHLARSGCAHTGGADDPLCTDIQQNKIHHRTQRLFHYSDGVRGVIFRTFIV